MLNVAPQKERIPDHLRAMAEQDDKSAASGKTGEQSSIGVGCAPGEEHDSAISICAVHSPPSLQRLLVRGDRITSTADQSKKIKFCDTEIMRKK